MTPSCIIGAVMFLALLIGFFVWVAYEDGIKTACVIFGVIFGIFAWMSIAKYLLEPCLR